MVIGNDGMEMKVKIAGGVNTCLVPTFMVLQNPCATYQIRNLPYDFSGACYLSGSRGGWILFAFLGSGYVKNL